jgi:hypothetical protein
MRTKLTVEKTLSKELVGKTRCIPQNATSTQKMETFNGINLRIVSDGKIFIVKI